MYRKTCALALAFALAVSAAWSASAQTKPAGNDPAPVKGLKWRSIGPFRGGRVTAVAGVPNQPNVYYFGGTGSGVWKTTDGGVNWDNVSDGWFGTGSVGAVAVAESDPNVIYVGMGEAPIRGNVSHGDGVYKSMDAGKTWKKVGLEDTRHISRIRIHPKNPDVAYVAALGHCFGPNKDRGVFRTTDGGKTWQKVFDRGDKAGAIDLALDPSNPRVLYAGFWEVVRKPWTLESGGPGSGIFKTTDGGDTWTDLTRNPGLPQKSIIGKVGITVSPANPERVWALVEAEDGGVFRSDNGGERWTRVNDERKLRQRAWYYSRIYADPMNADVVYALNTGFYRSNDGGRTFNPIGVPHGDNHDLWIAPTDPQRMIESNDGGANVSTNGGRTWTEQDQATAQFYRVTVDNDFPYNIYGAQQDNSTIRITSRSNGSVIDRTEWHAVGGGESGWIAPHPKDSNIVFAGSYDGLLTRYDHRTGHTRDVTVWPDNPMGSGADGMKYRFQWNFPILFSPHEANTLYAGGNILFKSTNEGQSWEAISKDLTRNDPSKLGPSGGPITKDNTGVEYYCTIFTVMESPVKAGVIWAGSDDGLVHVTQDGGKTWTNVTPKDMPEWIQINSIEASAHDPGTAYFAATMYKHDDFRPFLYKTTDYGKTWTKITTGIPDNDFTRVIREDPGRKGLLFAGTETGFYASFNDGANWQRMQLNLPIVPITDIAIHKRDADIVVATQGRSFWVLDDLPMLRQVTDGVAAADMHLYKPEDAVRAASGGGFELPRNVPAGQNPPNGAVIYYHLKNKPTGPVKLEILDAAGKTVRTFSSAGGPAAPVPTGDDDFPFAAGGARVTADAGLNRFVWDYRYANAEGFPGMILWAGDMRGPKAVPGGYKVRLTVDGKTATQDFEIKKDPRVTATQEDFVKQFDLSMKIREEVTLMHTEIMWIRDVRKQIEDLTTRLKDQADAKPVLDAAKTLVQEMTAVEEAFYQTKNRSNQDPLNFPIRLNNKLAALNGVVGGAEGAPNAQSYAVFEDLMAKAKPHHDKLATIKKEGLANLNKLLRDQNIPLVMERAKPATPGM